MKPVNFFFCLSFLQNIITEIVRYKGTTLYLKSSSLYQDSLYFIEKINQEKLKKYFIRGINALYLFRQIKNKAP
jgi:hypothetical protein